MAKSKDTVRLDWLFPAHKIKKQGDRWWAVCDLLDTPGLSDVREAIDAAMAAEKKARRK